MKKRQYISPAINQWNVEVSAPMAASNQYIYIKPDEYDPGTMTDLAKKRESLWDVENVGEEEE